MNWHLYNVFYRLLSQSSSIFLQYFLGPAHLPLQKTIISVQRIAITDVTIDNSLKTAALVDKIRLAY